MLTSNASKKLLIIAREAIKSAVSGQTYNPTEQEEKTLNENAGCFVTLKKQGQLRGCIGNFAAQTPLYQQVAAMAAAAATEDPRFDQVDADEVKKLELEITVLSPLQKIEETEQIEIGCHGLYIIKGTRRGVLLPQVATENSWDRQTFLEQTCRKAGLPANAWYDSDTEIYIFSGQIITENN
jgi:AmmeMemoRadiSam system protein A